MSPSELDHLRALLSRLDPELEDLVGKTTRLWNFMTSESYETLAKDDRMDLAEQWKHMDCYAAVLARRIDRMEANLPEDEMLDRRRKAQQRVRSEQSGS